MMDVGQQIKVENGMLKYLVEGLRTTLAWETQGTEYCRKLSTLRFIAHSFQRHMERLMTLEEYDGYMEDVLARNPNLRNTVGALRREHDVFRKGIREIIRELEHVVASDQSSFTKVCDELAVWLKKLDGHHEKEMDVLQEAFEREEGGGD
jgi:hemerythrin-like domain-containing protein